MGARSSCPQSLPVSVSSSSLEASTRIVKEHFVKVAQPEHEDIVWVLLLDVEILLHHGGEFHAVSPPLEKIAGLPAPARRLPDDFKQGCNAPCVAALFGHMESKNGKAVSCRSFRRRRHSCRRRPWAPRR